MPLFHSSLLKYSVLLLLSTATNSAFALGFGDIELSSYLGEELNAKIQINDIDSTPDIGCFVLKDLTENATQRRISASLIAHNSQYSLKMSTRAFLTEPIVNISVSYVCEPHVVREYVLLLDPAPLNNIAPTSAAVSANNAVPAGNSNDIPPKAKKAQKNNKIQPQVEIDSNSNSATSTNPLEKPVIRKPKAPAQTKQNNIDAQLSEAYTGSQETANTNAIESHGFDTQNKPTPNTSKPYLVISGGNLSGGSPYENTQAGLTLRLETEIDFARAEQNPPMITNEDAMDEATVMANRLAHLETQILSLQTINTQLKTKLVETENAGFKLSESQLTFLRYLLYAAILVLLLIVAVFVRRELIKRKLERDEAIWFVGNEEPSIADDSLMPASKVSDAIFKSTMLDNVDDILASPPQTTLSTSANVNAYAATEQEAENVLDHAEVFIAHGRTNLAIQLLQNHLEEFPTESPNVWLRLLALLAGESSEADYEQAVTECNQFFNIKLPNYADALLDDNSTIEEYPHIVQRLEGAWGSPFAVNFLNDLIYNQQSQPREGFARQTFEELFFLRQIATILAKDFTHDGVSEAYAASAIKPVLQNVAMNEVVFNSDDATNAPASDNNLSMNDFNDVKVTDSNMYPANAAPDAVDEDFKIASFAAEDYDDNDFIFETVESVASATDLPLEVPDFNQGIESSFEERSIDSSFLATPDTPVHSVDHHLDDAGLFEVKDNDAVAATAEHSLDEYNLEEGALEFDMSGLESIGLQSTNNSASEINVTEKTAEDTGNLIEFDWGLTEDSDATPKDDSTTASKSSKPRARKKT